VGVAAEHDINDRTIIERRDPLLGQVFDRRFQVDAKLASGGFGAIYRAKHIKSGHEFALKVLHHNLTSDARVVARFRREGAALTKLRDPHTITAYELGETPDGMLYILMELLRGESLFERFRAQGPLPWPQVIAIARSVCSSLAEAHGHGIIHRDLKPTNIHLEPGVDGRDHVKVLDFGIAKIVQESDIDSSDLTHAGQMIGTIDYMSPEQMVGGMCTATSDIYTLGIVMYEMIAGRRPFDNANSPAAALAAVLTTTPDRLSAHAVVTPEVDRIVMRCLEQKHGDRFQSAIELAAALDDILLDGDEIVTRLARSVPSAASTFESALATTKPLPGLTVRAPAGPQLAAVVAPPGTQGVQRTRGTSTTPATQGAVTAVKTPVPRSPRPTPSVPAPPPIDHNATLIGHLPAITRRAAATHRQHAVGSAPIDAQEVSTVSAVSAVQADGSLAPANSLRVAYPTIHRPRPSPMRPPTPSPFDDRPASSVSAVKRYEMVPAVQRDRGFRGIALTVCVAIAIIAAYVIATWL
jgi:eukaryotic-like serine/threonine-protein kinase